MNNEKLQTLMNQNKLVDAYSYVIELLQLDPKNAVAWKAKSYIEYKNQNLNDALLSINQAIFLNPKDFEAQKNKGIILIKNGSNQSAYRLFKKLLKFNPNVIDLHIKLGAISYELSHWHEAIKHYNDALNLDDSHKQVQASLGRIYFQLKQYKNAISYYQKGLLLDSLDSAVLSDLAVCFIETQDYNNAELYLKKALAINELSATTQNSLGIVNIKLGKLSAGITHFKEAIFLDKLNCDAYENLISTLIETTAINEASNLADIAIKLFNKNIKYKALKAICLRKLIGTQAAISYLKSELHNDDDNKTLHVMLGENNFEACEFNVASKIFEELSKLKNGHNAFYKLATLRLYEGRDDIAESILQKISNSSNLEFVLKSNIDLATIKYINNDLIGAKECLDKSQQIDGERSPWSRNYYAYWIYLNKLINDQVYSNSNDNNLKKTYVIGDSHSIGINGLEVGKFNHKLVLQTKWIPGLKLWHLAENENNKYKIRLQSIISKIDSNDIYFSLGEIDSRYNEGVYFYAKKNNLNCETVAIDTIEKAIISIKKICSINNINISFFGIPAPSISVLNYIANETEKLKYIKFIENFNTLFNEISIRMGCKYIDVFTEVTASIRGGKSDAHIDDFHLRPEFYKHILIKNNFQN